MKSKAGIQSIYLQGSCASILTANGVSIVGPHHLIDPVTLEGQWLLGWHHTKFFQLEPNRSKDSLNVLAHCEHLREALFCGLGMAAFLEATVLFTP